MKKILLFLLGFGIVSALAIAGAGYWWFQQALTPAEPEGGAERVRFEVAEGATLDGVARSLEAKGLIRDARAAQVFARAEEIASQLKVGEYELSAAQSTPEILQVLVEGRVQTHSVSIPEGLRASEIADRVEAAGLAQRDAFLAIVQDPDAAKKRGLEAETLEGYLYPDTYRFAKGLPAERIVDAMVDEFRSVYAELAAEADPPLDFTMHEVVTLASIVEKETGAAHERPLIAAVFLNRLRRGMRLETDPSVIYGVPNFDGNLRRVHLRDASNPYNTYKIRALPPGPIASPGREALRAVFHSADTPYLYFVSRNDGTHIFSKTYAEHDKAVNRYQRRRRSK